MTSPDRTKKLIRTLLDAPEKRWRVSILMPTHRAGPEVRQDRIRFKNLVERAEEQIREREGSLSKEFEDMLEPARALVDDNEFWNHQEGGLAVYLDVDGLHELRVPDELTERCVVHERYHLKPLLPRLRGDGTYHVLALSRNDVRLLRCTRDTVERLDRGDIPRSLEDALGHEKERESLQGHISHRQGGAGVVQPHGHGEGDDDRAVELKSFLQKVDAAVDDRLASEPGPIVLAGVDEVAATFRKLSRMHDRIVADEVEGNPDETDDTDLHDRSWDLVEDAFDDDLDRAREQFAQLEGTGRTLQDPDDVLKATAEGRVRTLLVAIDDERWGRMDTDEHTVERHDEQQAGDEDLVDRAAVLGEKRGARVLFAVTQDMPGKRPLAAVMHG